MIIMPKKKGYKRKTTMKRKRGRPRKR